MKIKTLFLICMGLLLLLGCSNTSENQERNPRENLNFFYNVQGLEEEKEAAPRVKKYYYGEHHFRQ